MPKIAPCVALQSRIIDDRAAEAGEDHDSVFGCNVFGQHVLAYLLVLPYP